MQHSMNLHERYWETLIIAGGSAKDGLCQRWKGLKRPKCLSRITNYVPFHVWSNSGRRQTTVLSKIKTFFFREWKRRPYFHKCIGWNQTLLSIYNIRNCRIISEKFDSTSKLIQIDLNLIWIPSGMKWRSLVAQPNDKEGMTPSITVPDRSHSRDLQSWKQNATVAGIGAAERVGCLFETSRSPPTEKR